MRKCGPSPEAVLCLHQQVALLINPLLRSWVGRGFPFRYEWLTVQQSNISSEMIEWLFGSCRPTLHDILVAHWPLHWMQKQVEVAHLPAGWMTPTQIVLIHWLWVPAAELPQRSHRTLEVIWVIITWSMASISSQETLIEGGARGHRFDTGQRR